MLKRLLVAVVLIMALFSIQSSSIVLAQDCEIPSSGPWPPCATGGNTSSGDCVIPSSGPWPSCATGGNQTTHDNCVIPPSGPWPACATGGNTTPTNVDDDCVIPPSGPWPPCATGGGSAATPTPEPAADPEPKEEATPEPTEEAEPEPVVEDDGEFRITSVEFSDITSRKVIVTFNYFNLPVSYRPLFRVADPDNCGDFCDSPNLLEKYPISGNHRIENPQKDGTVTMEIGIDNLFCHRTYDTQRLILAMADYGPLFDNGRTTVDYIIEIPFEHTWCND